jgi:plastocyanin
MSTLTRRTALAIAAGLLAGAARRARAAEASVTIDNFAFTPAELRVSAGTKVTWLNRDDIPHTVTSSATPPVFRSHPMDTGDSYTFAFDKPGTYRYFCSIHPHMLGSILVT